MLETIKSRHPLNEPTNTRRRGGGETPRRFWDRPTAAPSWFERQRRAPVSNDTRSSQSAGFDTKWKYPFKKDLIKSGRLPAAIQYVLELKNRKTWMTWFVRLKMFSLFFISLGCYYCARTTPGRERERERQIMKKAFFLLPVPWLPLGPSLPLPLEAKSGRRTSTKNKWTKKQIR